jgi:GntR family transcriptional regulator, transcriptional repressor for pyruvate dehydrogenase complex
MDEMFDFSLRRDKLPQQVADQLQDLILTASLCPGDKLPGERELAERMGVSRTVIREAIRVLSDRGLVKVKSGCGTYVRALSHKDAAASIELFLKQRPSGQSFQHVAEVRRMIEVEAAGLAAERATANDYAKMEAAIQGMASAILDPNRYAEHDVAFHSAVIDATHNDLINVLLGPISDLLAEMVRVSLDAPRAVEEGLAHHRNILVQIRAGDPIQARQAMRAHVEHAQTLVASAHKSATPALQGE